MLRRRWEQGAAAQQWAWIRLFRSPPLTLVPAPRTRARCGRGAVSCSKGSRSKGSRSRRTDTHSIPPRQPCDGYQSVPGISDVIACLRRVDIALPRRNARS